MCELFALSSRLPTVVDMSLEEFSRHGGLTEEEWRPLDEGELVAISAAQHVIAPPAPSPRT